MPLPGVSLAVVGAEHPNKRGPTRRFAIELCKPGETVSLVPEPRNPADPQAIQVRDAAGTVMGYVRAEQAQWIGQLLRNARITAAVFQQSMPWGAIIRLGLDGEEPILPPAARPDPPMDDSGLWPDEQPDD